MREMITRSTSVDIKQSQDSPPLDITVNDRAATREVLFERLRALGLAVVERSAWHAKPSKEGMEPDWDYTMIAIHHAGRSFGCAMGKAQMNKIQSKHMAGEYSDVAYHFGIDCQGMILEARDLRLKGGHLSGYNSGVIGIVLLEDLSTPEEGDDVIAAARQVMEYAGVNTRNSVPDAQRRSLLMLIEALSDLFNIRALGGHREFPRQHGEGKICPGSIGLTLVENLRARLKLSAPASE